VPERSTRGPNREAKREFPVDGVEGGVHIQQKKKKKKNGELVDFVRNSMINVSKLGIEGSGMQDKDLRQARWAKVYINQGKKKEKKFLARRIGGHSVCTIRATRDGKNVGKESGDERAKDEGIERIRRRIPRCGGGRRGQRAAPQGHEGPNRDRGRFRTRQRGEE